MKSYRMLLLILITIPISLLSQSNSKITYYYHKDGFIEKVVFANKTEFIINENNPFIQDFPLIFMSAGTVRWYDISGIDISVILKKLPKLHYRDNLSADQYSFDILTTRAIPSDYSKNYFAIAYDVILKEKGIAVACGSVMKVFNSFGEIIFEKNDVGSDCGSLTITDDGELIAYKYGLGHDESGRMLNPGIVVYNTLTNKKVDEIVDDSEDAYIIGLAGFKNLIYLSIKNFSTDSVKLIYYDSQKKLKYTKTLQSDSFRRRLSIDYEGLTMRGVVNGDTNCYKLYFNRDFKVEELFNE